MIQRSNVEDLQLKVDYLFNRHALYRRNVAYLVMIVICLVNGFFAWYLTNSYVVSALAVLFSGFLGTEISLRRVLLNASEYNRYKKLIKGALKHPTIIRRVTVNQLVLDDGAGEVSLTGFGFKVWRQVTNQLLTHSNDDADDSVELEVPDANHSDLAVDSVETRSDAVQDANNFVLEKSPEPSDVAGTLNDKETILFELEAEIKAEQEEVERQRKAIADAENLLMSAVSENKNSHDMEGLRAAIGGNQASMSPEKRIENLVQAVRNLEERSKYVADVEESLIARLNEISEREAMIEHMEQEGSVMPPNHM